MTAPTSGAPGTPILRDPGRRLRDRRLDWRRLVRRLILAAALAASLLAVSAGTAVASVPKPPVVHDWLGWNQNLTGRRSSVPCTAVSRRRRSTATSS
jgi:hypothetical protein